MPNFLKALVLSAVLALPSLALASNWSIDPDHSNVAFKVKHLMVSNVTGNFEKHTGIVEIDDKDITKSRVSVTIDINSINTHQQKRDEHLRSADFFNAAQYPTMTFVSKKVTKAANGALKITGFLTIHGITKEVVLNADPLSPEMKDPWGNVRCGTTATTRINRNDFGLTWNKALETGGLLIGDEVVINLEIEMIKAKN